MSDHIPIPKWNTTLSRTLAFAEIKPKIIDYAIAIGTASALDNLGVAFALFTPAAFNAYFGVVPQPRSAMVPCVGDSAQITNWNVLNVAASEQVAKLVLLKSTLCTIFPRDLLISLEDEKGSLRQRSPEYIFSALELQLGTLTKADIDTLMSRLTEPYVEGASVESFVASYQATLRTLDRANQSLSNYMAITMLQSCFSQQMTPCWVKFVQDVPLIANRTLNNLCIAIILYYRDVIPIIHAHDKITNQQAKEQINELRQEILELRAISMATATTNGSNIESNINITNVNKTKNSKVSKIINNSYEQTGHRSLSFVKKQKLKKKRKKRKKVQDTLKLLLEPVQSVVPLIVSMSGAANSVYNSSNIAPVLAISDTGATGTYLQTADMHTLHDVHLSAANEQIVVAVANGTLLRSTHHGSLQIPGHGSILAHVLPQLKGSLLSVSQLVDLGLRVTYCSAWVTVLNPNDDVIFQGHRDSISGLWMVDLLNLSTGESAETDPIGSASAAIRLDSASDFVNFWHAAYGSPVASTFVAAIDNGYIRVPGLTSAKVRRHLPNTVATAHGHLTATRKGIKSSRSQTKFNGTGPSLIEANAQDVLCAAEKRLWVQIDDVRTGRTHADAAGPLPMRARSSALYQIIFYNEDTNYIHIETTTSRGGPELLAALQRAIKFFNERGILIELIRMDNECSKLTKEWIKTEAMTLELTPVAIHRTNKAERAIRTWKDHFIATLATTDPGCPLFLWEDFLEQSELTLNSLRESRVHPLLSAWEALCGKFDVMATPIAPLGMKVMVHDTPEKRGTWQVHGSMGFYIGRALLHYRCHNVWMTESRATRISNCLAWFPTLVKMPGSSPIEELTVVVNDVRSILKKLADIPSSDLQPGVDKALAEQLRDVRNLFCPPAVESINNDIWPRGQQVVPRSPTHLRIADALPDTIPAPLQRVPIVQPQRVPTEELPRVPTVRPNVPTSIIVPLRVNQQVRPLTKARCRHHYFDLSDAEVNKIPKAKFNRIGKLFVDDDDPLDTATGVVTGIVRHKKSRKLAFKYWNHQLHDSEPSSPADFEYIDINHAMSKGKWSKYKPIALHIAATAVLEESYRNMGISRNSKKKARQRQRYVPWNHKRLNLINSAVEKLRTTMQADFQTYSTHYACTALDLNADGSRLTSASALKGPDKALWEKAHGEEIIRLIESGTGRFISRSDMPTDRKAAYYNPQLKIKSKSDGMQYRVRGTIGGDQVHYPGITTAYTAHLETIRLMLNSVVSEDALFMTADIKDFYLGTPLDRLEYMRIHVKHIPKDVQLRYNIAHLIHNDYIIMEVSKGIYGLPQAGKLAQDRLIKHLAGHGYIQCINTPCLFIHQTNGVAFTLVVDDFLIKYKDKKAVDHLLSSLRELYIITTEFGVTQKYVGITLHHNRVKRYIDMSIPGYVQKAIQRFQRTNLKGADSPIIYVPPNYGKHQQEAPIEEPSLPLTAAEILELQEIVGVFLFYARAVDPTMLTAINKIASRQAKPTSLIKKEVERFLQYANKWPDATMRVRASNMKLVCHSDGSYLSESEARSRAGGIIFLGDCEDNEAPNAPVCFLSVIIKTVVTSATATEYAAAFIVAQAAISIINTLTELGYPQSKTEIFCDNLCAVGLANNTFNLKRTKTIDMRYHWIRDQVKLGVFKVTWKAGKLNLADFFTKAHPVQHHLQIRWKYVHMNEDAISITRSEGVLIHE